MTVPVLTAASSCPAHSGAITFSLSVLGVPARKVVHDITEFGTAHLPLTAQVLKSVKILQVMQCEHHYCLHIGCLAARLQRQRACTDDTAACSNH